MTSSSDVRLARRLERLEHTTLPRPAPDMTGWTSMERHTWKVEQVGLQELIRRSYAEPAEPLPQEVWDAQEARDQAILAERAAAAAADRLARHPGSAAAQLAARRTRDVADQLAKAAEQAERIAEEALRNPRPAATIEPAPAAEPPSAVAAPAATADPPSPEPKLQPQPEPKPEPQWWEERARWRLRGPEDYNWDDGDKPTLPECIHEYDAMCWDELGPPDEEVAY